MIAPLPHTTIVAIQTLPYAVAAVVLVVVVFTGVDQLTASSNSCVYHVTEQHDTGTVVKSSCQFTGREDNPLQIIPL